MELGLDDRDAKDLAQGLGDTKPSAQGSSSKPLSVNKSKEKGKHSEPQPPSKTANPPSLKPETSRAEVAEAAKQAGGTPPS